MVKSRKAAARGVETVVYCGPSIPGVAKQYSFYTNGIPAVLAAAISEYPPLEVLVVPLAQLPAAMKALRDKKGHTYRLYRLVQANFIRR